MSTRTDELRQELAELLNTAVPLDNNNDDDENAERLPENGVLTMFAAIVEWQGSDGKRWLSIISGDGVGSRDLPRWTLEMLGYELERWYDH